MSAVVFVGYRGNQDEELSQVNKYWEIVGGGIKVYLDLHIVYDDKRPWYSTTSDPQSNLGNNPYPVNLLRQISVDSAKTDWVLMSEGDMLTTPNAHAHIEESWDDMMKAYTEQGGAAFVVPLYRVRKSIDKKTFDEFPRTKQDLLKSTKPKRNILRNKNKKALPIFISVPVRHIGIRGCVTMTVGRLWRLEAIRFYPITTLVKKELSAIRQRDTLSKNRTSC